MDKKGDLAELFEQVSLIENKCCFVGMTVEEAGMTPKVMKIVPKEHTNVITNKRRAKGTDFCLDNLEDHAVGCWHAAGGGLTENQNHCSKPTLFAGDCHSCGQKSNQCPNCNNEKGGSGGGGKHPPQVGGACTTCGEKGHNLVQCWSDSKNAARRPSWWKLKGDAENGVAALDGVHLLLSGIDMPKDEDVEVAEMPKIGMNINLNTKHKNIWITDLRATVHSSFEEEGLRNIKEGNAEIAAAHVVTAKVEKTGNFNGWVCNWHGKALTRLALLDVLVMKDGCFNPFSIARLTQDG